MDEAKREQQAQTEMRIADWVNQLVLLWFVSMGLYQVHLFLY